jgi:hypothetical protein
MSCAIFECIACRYLFRRKYSPHRVNARFIGKGISRRHFVRSIGPAKFGGFLDEVGHCRNYQVHTQVNGLSQDMRVRCRPRTVALSDPFVEITLSRRKEMIVSIDSSCLRRMPQQNPHYSGCTSFSSFSRETCLSHAVQFLSSVLMCNVAYLPYSLLRSDPWSIP